jgi:OOP family OmpA-OmpF porin
MTTMQKTARTTGGLILLVAVMLSPPAWAQGGYLGFAVGQAKDRVLHENDTGYKIFGGFRFSPYLAGELAYVDLGSYGPPGSVLDQYGVAAQLVGHIPLGQSGASLFAKVGLFSWSVQLNGSYYYSYAEDNGVDPAVGAGLQIEFNRFMGMRAEWERFLDVAGGDVDLVTAGLFYRF